MSDLTGIGNAYGFSPETPTPVRINVAVAATSTRVRVTFSVEMKHVNPADIEDVLYLTNWSFTAITPGANPINPTGTVSVVQAAPTIVDIDTDAEMTDGATYEVHVVNVRSAEGSGLVIGGGDRQFTGAGVQPTVSSANSPASFRVVVTFSEAMKDNAALTTPGNYTFTGPTTLNSASVLRLNDTQVQITTAEEMQGGGAYTVEVNNVEDVAGNPIDTLANTALFSGTGTGPRLLSAYSTGPGKVRVTFSEAMDAASATDHTNYSIESGGIPLTVSGATQIHGALYELDTAEQETDKAYILTVSSSVLDQVGNPVLPPYNQKSFAGIGKTFPVITFYPVDESTDVDVFEFFSVHVVDDARYFSGIDIDSVQISVEYELNGHTVTLDIVEDGDFRSYVDGELSGEAGTTIGLTYRFRLPGSWHGETAYTISVEATDVDGYTATASAVVTTGVGYNPCAMDHLWKLVPERMREMDSDQGNVLQDFVNIMRHMFSDICERITDFPNLRDPLTVRTSHNENDTIHIVSHTVGDGIVTLRVDDADDLSRASRGWILLDEDDGEFKIVAVRKRIQALPTDYQVPEIDIDGLVPPTYTVMTGEQTIRPQSLIDYLAADYGLDVDKNEPEGFQRSAIHNALQYLDLKGSVAAYVVRGLISGFDVSVIGLWYVTDGMVGDLPGGTYWQNPADSLYYTTTPPRMANFDEIPGDEIPCDQFCWEDPGDYEFAIASSITVNDLGDDGWEIVLDMGTDVSLLSQIGRWKVVDDPITTPEVIGAGDGSATAFNPTLNRDSVSPDSLTIEYTSSSVTKTITDDGNGNLVGNVDPNGVNTIDYVSGELEFTCSVPPDNTTDLEAVYSRDFWIERVDDGLFGTGIPKLYLSTYAISPLVNGANWKFRYDCPEQQFCWYCKSNKIRIEIEADEILEEPGADPDSALDRLVKKLLVDIVPAHVVVAFLAYKTYMKVYMTYSVTIELYPTTMMDAFMVDRFDAIEGSEGT